MNNSVKHFGFFFVQKLKLKILIHQQNFENIQPLIRIRQSKFPYSAFYTDYRLTRVVVCTNFAPQFREKYEAFPV